MEEGGDPPRQKQSGFGPCTNNSKTIHQHRKRPQFFCQCAGNIGCGVGTLSLDCCDAVLRSIRLVNHPGVVDSCERRWTVEGCGGLERGVWSGVTVCEKVARCSHSAADG